MGDLDVNLIKEFAARPEFYDRSNIRFKDKPYIKQSWQEISLVLGYDAHLLKDRMLQLRNRYNLEKRRIEAYKMENPKQVVESPWALFSHLQFLDRHIRPRRSYKTMMRRNRDPDNMVSIEDPTSLLCLQELQSSSNFQYPGGNKNVQMKYESDIESEDDRQSNNGKAFSDSGIYTIEDSQGANDTMSTDATHNEPVPSGLSVCKVESLKRKCSMEDSQYQSSGNCQKVPQFEKFETFGKFLSVSLCELPEERALLLIEKFTTDIVKAMLDSKRTSPA